MQAEPHYEDVVAEVADFLLSRAEAAMAGALNIQLGGEATRLSDDDLTRIADLVAKARKDGKR